MGRALTRKGRGLWVGPPGRGAGGGRAWIMGGVLGRGGSACGRGPGAWRGQRGRGLVWWAEPGEFPGITTPFPPLKPVLSLEETLNVTEELLVGGTATLSWPAQG